jgi:hypothetical protein
MNKKELAEVTEKMVDLYMQIKIRPRNEVIKLTYILIVALIYLRKGLRL